LADEIRAGILGYGDPPMHKECSFGYTMTSEAVRVIEYWHQEKFRWVRKPELERRFDARDEKSAFIFPATDSTSVPLCDTLSWIEENADVQDSDAALYEAGLTGTSSLENLIKGLGKEEVGGAADN